VLGYVYIRRQAICIHNVAVLAGRVGIDDLGGAVGFMRILAVLSVAGSIGISAVNEHGVDAERSGHSTCAFVGEEVSEWTAGAEYLASELSDSTSEATETPSTS